MHDVCCEHERSLVEGIEDVARLLASTDNVEVVVGMSVLVLIPRTFNSTPVKPRKERVKSPEVALVVEVIASLVLVIVIVICCEAVRWST